MIRDTFRMRKQNLPCIFLLCKYPVIFIVAGRAGGRARWIYPRGIAADTVEKGKEREDGRVGYVAAETKRQKSRRYLGLTAFTELFFENFFCRNDGRKKGETHFPIEN